MRLLLRDLLDGVSGAIKQIARETAREYRHTSRMLGHDRRSLLDLLVDADSAGSVFTRAGAAAHASTFRGLGPIYRPSHAEAAMAARRMVDEVKFTGDMAFDVLAANGVVRKMRSEDGELSVYKPTRGERLENMEWYYATRGAQTSREIAAYRLSEILGFGRIPPTARTRGVPGDDKRTGPGMIQQFVESKAARDDTRDYPLVQRQQMAILDYIMGAEDRNWANFRSVERGYDVDIVALDHGRCFPITDQPLEAKVRSPFVIGQVTGDSPLDPEVLAAVRDIDTYRLIAAWTDAGLEPKAIDGALARLVKVQELGDIPKDARWDF
ncbi:hypothetical protein [Nocardia sp. NPDC019395]|uniref:hypothetical protein n=1 Tax=Nocardia sp. NPDC019395 TaxID=3154686 RepID=UPI00340A5EC6